MSVVQRKRKKNEVVTVLHVDESYGHGNARLLEKEKEASKRFQIIQSKPRKLLVHCGSEHFNGGTIGVHGSGRHTLTQSHKRRKLESPVVKDAFRSVRAAIQYIDTYTSSDVCPIVQLMALKSRPAAFKQMNKIINWCRETADAGLTIVPLEK